MRNTSEFKPRPALDGFAVQTLEEALSKSPTKSVTLLINNTLYQLSQEGQWFKLSLLNKKRTIKRSKIVETLSEVYNQFIHGCAWQISTI